MDPGSESHLCRALRQDIERSLRRAFDPMDVVPRLVRLARLASASSDDGVFAHRQLAELLVERHPWRAALYARRALVHRRDDERAWAVLAFSQTLLGNFRCAARAHHQAIALAPSNPWYAHNLGHLLDVALGTPKKALPWLRTAYECKTDSSEIVASYVHALARAGHRSQARGVLEHALERFDSRELEALLRWVDQGAPSRAGATLTATEATPSRARNRTAAQEPAPSHRQLARMLARGLAHLPLDARQRQRALALARDLADTARMKAEAAATAELVASARAANVGLTRDKGTVPKKRVAAARPKRKTEDVAGLAAAVAYAIVYVDHVPLSQAEVAAPFRVAVSRLRGRFAELRAKLDIVPGDTRYATSRRR